ncbi:MAG: acyl-CoA/acyl-ACP dehydrogenase [Ruminiclostridium sp.]|nr:acyl-CoA/acyl-ACP dehydrogenase [Ruminiclostridium sp.]
MEFLLNEDQQMIHDLAKDFAQTVLAPRIEEIEAGELVEVSTGEKLPQLPHDIHMQLAECGFIGISFPEEYNGMGMGHVEQTIILKELSRVSPSVGKCLDVYILGLEALDLYASPEQKAKYLAPCCSGEQTVSFAFTEPETGSDPKMLKTRLTKQADGTYLLNGVKRFISNAAYDGPCVLFALEATEEGKDIVTGLVIDKFCKGYSISSPWDKIGYKGSHVYDIFMDDIVVTEDQILGKHGDGFTQLLGTTAYGKLGFTAVFVGTALGAADLALAYCQEKLHRGKSITKFPTTQLRLSTMLTYAHTAELLMLEAADYCDHNHFENDDIATMRAVQARTAQAKGYAAETATKVATMAVNAMGAYGVCDEYQVERFLRDAAIAPNIEGSGDIQYLIHGMYVAANGNTN